MPDFQSYIKYKNIEIDRSKRTSLYLCKEDDEIYAIKKIPIASKDTNKAKKEASILINIKSPFLIKCYSFYIINSNLCFVMKYCPHGTLREKITKAMKDNEQLKENFIMEIFTKICIGVAELHKNKIIHKNLVPENIFLFDETEPRIGNFGLFKGLSSNKDNSSNSNYYISHGFVNSEGYEEKIDIWSLGCILYELCTFNLPFSGPSETFDLPSSYSDGLKNLVSKMLQKNPNSKTSIFNILKENYVEKYIRKYNLRYYNVYDDLSNNEEEPLLKDYKFYKEFDGHDDYVKCLCLINSEKFASCSTDGKIKIWNIETFECLITLKVERSVWYVSKLSDENHLVCCGGNWEKGGFISVWNIDGARQEKLVSNFAFHVNKVSEVSNGKICSCDTGGNLIFFKNKAPYNCEKKLTNNDKIHSFIEIKNKNKIISSSSEYIKVWNLINYNCEKAILNLSCSENYQNLLQFDDNTILIGGKKYIYIIDATRFSFKTKIQTGNSWNRCLEKLADENNVICGGSSGELYTVNIKSNKTIDKKDEAHESKINSLLVIRNILLSSSNGKEIKIWK